MGKQKCMSEKKINYHLRLTNPDIIPENFMSDQNRTPVNILLILKKNIFLTLLKIIPVCV